MKNCLGINDNQQYKEFILKCPNIDNDIILKTNAKLSNMLDQIKSKSQYSLVYNEEYEKTIATKQSQSNTLPQHEYTPTKFYTYTERKQDIKDFLSILIPALYTYTKTQPQDKYTNIYLEWFNKGLMEHTTFQELMDIMNINDMEELYALLTTTPHLKQVLMLEWEHNYILYQQLVSTKRNQLHIVHSDQQLMELHSIIQNILYDWAFDATGPIHHTKVILKQHFTNGLNSVATWNHIQLLLIIKTH